MPKFGDVVIYQMGKVSVKALVVQTSNQPDGVHCTLVYLDPAAASNSMAGAAVDKAIAKGFCAPLKDNMTYGWKELASDIPAGESEEIATATTDDKAQDQIKALAYKNADLEDELDDLKKQLGDAQSETDNLLTVQATLNQQVETLQKQLADTTEGRDRTLQALADASAKSAPGQVSDAGGQEH